MVDQLTGEQQPRGEHHLATHTPVNTTNTTTITGMDRGEGEDCARVHTIG